MRKTGFLIAIGFLVSFQVFAEDKCSCKEFQKSNSDLQEIIVSLERTDLEFEANITTKSVRGVLNAKYYYCANDQGFLLVKLDDKEMLYKNVPLQTWFEFKFASESTSFYKDRIKYNYISI